MAANENIFLLRASPDAGIAAGSRVPRSLFPAKILRQIPATKYLSPDRRFVTFFAILQENAAARQRRRSKNTMNTKTYPRTNDRRTIYLNTVIDNPYIEVGDYTIYNDFVNDRQSSEKSNVLPKNYPPMSDSARSSRQILPRSPAGARFLFNSANHHAQLAGQFTTFRSSSRSGNSTKRTSPRRGTTRATSSSATTYGSVTKRSSWRASGSATAP